MIDSFSGQYAFLSNFYAHEIEYEDAVYPTNEHAFQAAKTDDKAARAAIAAAATPTQAKKLGRSVDLIPGWDQYWRYWTMENLIYVKFSPKSSLSLDLLITSPRALIEGNAWHDQIWGDCRCGGFSCRTVGMNLLGYMLMRHREHLQETGLSG